MDLYTTYQVVHGIVDSTNLVPVAGIKSRQDASGPIKGQRILRQACFSPSRQKSHDQAQVTGCEPENARHMTWGRGETRPVDTAFEGGKSMKGPFFSGANAVKIICFNCLQFSQMLSNIQSEKFVSKLREVNGGAW